MASPNPLEKAYPIPPAEVSEQSYHVAGILTTVYGLKELDPNVKNVACLWLLHPRLQTQACMKPVAASAIQYWSDRHQQTKSRKLAIGLVAISFDQRNHGSREVDKLANQAWSAGNRRHAQDMFSIYHGTSVDTSHLIDHISSYVFPSSEHIISSNMVCGISLGGHAAWQCLIHDPRITSAIVIIGCPDYVALMSDRARLSKLSTWTNGSPPGSAFLGSVDFPAGLLEAIDKYDPKAFLLGELSSRNKNLYNRQPSENEKERLIPLMKSSLQGKRVLNLAGGADKLVPYRCGEPFLQWLKKSTAKEGWFGEGNVTIEDVVFEGVGHELSLGMAKELNRFIAETLEQSLSEKSGKTSKI